MRYNLILHQDLRAQINALSEARKRDPRSDESKEYVAVIKGLKALQEGREGSTKASSLATARGRMT